VEVQRADLPLSGEGWRHRGRARFGPAGGPARGLQKALLHWQVSGAWIDKLLPGVSALQQQVRAQAQTSNKRDLDYSALALTDTLIMLAEAVFQGMPFRIKEYGASCALLQLPAVRELVTCKQWGEFAAKVVSSHASMEQLRQSPWQAMIPGLAGTLSQLQGGVQGLTAAAQQQTAAGQAQQVQQVQLPQQSSLSRTLSQLCRWLWRPQLQAQVAAGLQQRTQPAAPASSRCPCQRSAPRWPPACCAAACAQSRRHTRCPEMPRDAP
jgi:hypothetical protein